MPALPTLFAHAGHWVESIAFAAPAILLPIGLAVMVLIERRRGQR